MVFIMTLFINPSLNYILYLFEHKIDTPKFKDEILTYLNNCDPESFLEETSDYGNILAILCQLPQYNKNTLFTSAFIFLMNNMMMRLYTLNRSILNLSVLINPTQADSILILLLKIQKYKAAVACLTHFKVLSEKFPIIKQSTRDRLFQQDNQGKFAINQFFPNASWLNFKELTYFVILTHINLDVSQELIIRWLLSIVNIDTLDLDNLMMSEELTKIQIENFLDALTMFCDFNILKKIDLMNLIRGSNNGLSQIDFTLTRKKLNLKYFEAILNFYQELFHNHHLTKDEFHQQVIAHPRHGFSHMHQLILQGHYDGLSIYLEYLDNLLKENILTKQQVREAFLKTNAKGFNCLFQAINSFHEDIPKLFIRHLMKHFSKTEVLDLFREGSYNPIYKRFFQPRCAVDKPHYQSTNKMVSLLKKSLENELEYHSQNDFIFFSSISKESMSSSEDDLGAASIPTALRKPSHFN